MFHYYSLMYITSSNNFKTLSLPNGEFGVLEADQSYTHAAPFEIDLIAFLIE